MIELKIDGKGYTLDDELRGEINARIGGLDEHMEVLDTGHVIVSWEGGTDEFTKVHAQLWGKGHRFEASDMDRNPIASIDKAGQKLAKQIRREHRKEVARHRNG
jgi:ribosomal subunit interface protein